MNNSFTLQKLAEYLGAEWIGDPQHSVSGIASLDRAEAHHLSFVSKKQFESHLQTTRAGIVIIKNDTTAPERVNVLRVPDPYLAYAKATKLFCRRSKLPPGIHPSAAVDPSAV